MGRPDFNILANMHFLKDFDVHLQEFYKILIGKEIGFRFKSYAEDIRGILDELVLHYRKKYKEKVAINLRFETKKRRCAYVLKNSPLFASTVAFHFTKLFLKNRTILMKPFKNRQLNLCCLGGGPVPEVVGFLKVLGPLYSSTGNPEPLQLKVTVVDVEEKWKTTCEFVLQCLKEDGTFEGLNKIAIDFNFFKADLTKPFDDDLKVVMKEADIVTMVYFLSTVNGGEYTEESFEMIKKIMDGINEESILFFLEKATDVHFQQMDKAALEMKNMEAIYGPCLEDFRTLTLESVEKFLEIYKGYFGLMNCMTHGFMSYCAWRKVKSNIVLNDNEKEKRRKRLLLQKDNEYLTRKMRKYKRSLRELIDNLEKRGFEFTFKSNNDEPIIKENENNTENNVFRNENSSNQLSKCVGNFEETQLHRDTKATDLTSKENTQNLNEGHELFNETDPKQHDITNESDPKNTFNSVHVEEIEKEREEDKSFNKDNETVYEKEVRSTDLRDEDIENVEVQDTGLSYEENTLSPEDGIESIRKRDGRNTEEKGFSEGNRSEEYEEREQVIIRKERTEKPKAPKTPLLKPRKLKLKETSVSEETKALMVIQNEDKSSSKSEEYAEREQVIIRKERIEKPKAPKTPLLKPRKLKLKEISVSDGEAKGLSNLLPKLYTDPKQKLRGFAKSGVAMASSFSHLGRKKDKVESKTISDNIAIKETYESPLFNKIQKLKLPIKVPTLPPEVETNLSRNRGKEISKECNFKNSKGKENENIKVLSVNEKELVLSRIPLQKATNQNLKDIEKKPLSHSEDTPKNDYFTSNYNKKYPNRERKIYFLTADKSGELIRMEPRTNENDKIMAAKKNFEVLRFSRLNQSPSKENPKKDSRKSENVPKAPKYPRREKKIFFKISSSSIE